MVIGLMAVILSVSVESLTIVVAAHELAHAYSHLGRDIDGERWDSLSFARTDIRIVEGLAQFYTDVICQKLEERMPDAKRSYDLLLLKQPEPYCVQQGWGNQTSLTGEIVRGSMIECRSNRIQEYDKFSQCIERYCQQIKRINRSIKRKS